MEIAYATMKKWGILKAQDLVDRYGLNKRTLQRSDRAAFAQRWNQLTPEFRGRPDAVARLLS
jgi:hypothetical protein